MCSMFGVLMFEVFDVRYFGVRSKTINKASYYVCLVKLFSVLIEEMHLLLPTS